MTESGQVTWLNSIVETSKMTEKWSGLQILKSELDQKITNSCALNWLHEYDEVGQKYIDRVSSFFY